MNSTIKSRLNSACPALKEARLGDRLESGVYIQKVIVDTDASSGKNFTANISGEIVDVWAVSTATIASATVTLRRGTTGISSALDIATSGGLARTASLTQAQKNVTKGETLNLITAASTNRAVVYIAIIPD